MDSGAALAPLTVAYQTYGALNAAKSNAILLCHALTGDQHVANPHPVTGRPGWWETMVGPGKPFDTDRFFVICSNVLGGCMGSTGPASLNPETGEPYGLDFPIVTIADMVRAQALLIDHLGIDTLLCVAGGSMGGMQVLQWAATYPDRVFAALPDRDGGAPFLAEYRLPRGRPTGDHGRSGLAARALSRRGHEARQGPRRRTHGGAHHLSLRERAASQVRAQSPGPRGAHLLLRRGFSG